MFKELPQYVCYKSVMGRESLETAEEESSGAEEEKGLNGRIPVLETGAAGSSPELWCMFLSPCVKEGHVSQRNLCQVWLQISSTFSTWNSLRSAALLTLFIIAL